MKISAYCSFTEICKTPAFVALVLAAAFRYLLKWADYNGQSKYSRMWVGSNSFCFFIKIKECLKENQQLLYVRCHIINRQTKLCIVLIFYCQINCVFSLLFMSNGFIDFSWFFIILTEIALSCKMAALSIFFPLRHSTNTSIPWVGFVKLRR